MIARTAAIALLPLLALPAYAIDADTMRSRTVYQLVTDRFARNSSVTDTCTPSDRVYCGGTWSAITDKLDYIQGMGFDTIWISPVVSNIGGTTGEGEAYHGYWTLDPNSLNDNFGTEDELKALSAALHDRSMYLEVDVVINHVAATSSSDFAPSDSYGPFSTSDDYHTFCWISDYSNQTNVEQCWLGDTSVALPDLNTESDTVVDYWNTWIAGLVSNYTIDAIRIDTVKHIRVEFWPDFVSAAGVFTQAEVLLGTSDYVANYQVNGSTNPFNYPVYYPLIDAFNGTNQDFTTLIDMVSTVASDFSDPTLLGSFLNNHDQARFESYVTDTSLIKNAHAYPFVTDGIPYSYYGSEAGFTGGADPENREPLWTNDYDTTADMYTFFASLNAARSAAGNASSTFYTGLMSVTSLSDTSILIAKAPLMSILSNTGSSASDASATIDTSTSGWSASTTIIDAISCDTFTTDSSGDLTVTISSGLPLVLIEDSEKGNLCSSSSSSTSTSTSTSSSSSSTSSSSGASLTQKIGSWAVAVGVAFAGLQIVL